MKTTFLTNRSGLQIGFVRTLARDNAKPMPQVLFLGGFKSNMSGTKAVFLEQFCAQRGIGYVRFDYTGHGVSEGEFADGTIGAWTDDAEDVLRGCIDGDVILVGSSMGGWIALNLLLRHPQRVKGVIGIAAAPDFTREIEKRMTAQQKVEMKQTGRVYVPSAYGERYVYTQALIDDGEKHCLLDRDHSIAVPLILLQGKQDDAVPWQTAVKIKERFLGPRTEAVFIDDGDHRLSRSEDLAHLARVLEGILPASR